MNLHRTGTTLARGFALIVVFTVVAALLMWPATAEARPILQRGVAGGGTVELDESGEVVAELLIFASALIVPDADEAVLVVGSVKWVESGLVLESTEVTDCIVMQERDDGREVRGAMSVNGAGNYPFVLRVIDAGPPGSGFDSADLVVGQASDDGDATPTVRRRGFSYSAAGPIIGGDIENINNDIEIPDPVE